MEQGKWVVQALSGCTTFPAPTPDSPYLTDQGVYGSSIMEARLVKSLAVDNLTQPSALRPTLEVGNWG